MGRKPWASALRLISRNALASGSARLKIDAKKSFPEFRFRTCDMPMTSKEAMQHVDFSLQRNLERHCPWRWIEKIQRRFDWPAIVKDSHIASQTTNMRETPESKMIWMLPQNHHSRRFGRWCSRYSPATSILASGGRDRGIVRHRSKLFTQLTRTRHARMAQIIPATSNCLAGMV